MTVLNQSYYLMVYFHQSIHVYLGQKNKTKTQAPTPQPAPPVPEH